MIKLAVIYDSKTGNTKQAAKGSSHRTDCKRKTAKEILTEAFREIAEKAAPSGPP